MSKIIALDYGTVRTGIAITDELQIIASGLCTVATKELFSYLNQLILAEKISQVIIGWPLQMNGNVSENASNVEKFIIEFQKKYPLLPIEKIDERFTSKIAQQTLISSGIKKQKRQNKALLDEISATILLQDYLSYKK